jgi:hypothetical protein
MYFTFRHLIWIETIFNFNFDIHISCFLNPRANIIFMIKTLSSISTIFFVYVNMFEVKCQINGVALNGINLVICNCVWSLNWINSILTILSLHDHVILL